MENRSQLAGILSIVSGVLGVLVAGMVAGTIAASITFYPCGILSVIFVCLGKAEFERPAAPVVTPPPPATAIGLTTN